MYSMSSPCMGQRCSPSVCMACAESQAAVCSISTKLKMKSMSASCGQQSS